MTIPGLALFYGGLVRSKNMLSVLMQVFMIVCMVCGDLGALRLFRKPSPRRRPYNDYVGGLSEVQSPS